MIRLILSQDMKRTPWKNGLGMTTQIAIDPPNAHFPVDDFNWRVSSADVHSSNTFSSFQDYDRLLIVWKGSGLVLNGTQLLPLEVFRFSGEEEINCDLIDGSVVDFGIIFKRGQYQPMLDVLSITPDQPSLQSISDTDIRLLFCAAGSVRLDHHQLCEGDALLISAPEELQIQADASAVLLSLSVRRSLASHE